MYDEKMDEPAHASNTAIAEDLGQIEYVFTDKTGTLTENIMVFKQCTIGSYLFGSNDANYAAIQDEKLTQFIQANKVPQVRNFFRSLALCHSVVPIANPRSANIPIYRGSSPDEEALVEAAAELGFVFSSKSVDTLNINVLGNLELYKVLQVFEFSSDRKRMSVLVRQILNGGRLGKISLFTKGADDVIFAACHKHDGKLLKDTNIHLEAFAEVGYRTLCVAMREISEMEYKGTLREERSDIPSPDDSMGIQIPNCQYRAERT